MLKRIRHRALGRLPKSSTVSQMSTVFNCGRKQIQSVLKRKEANLSDYEANSPASRKHCRGREHRNVIEAVFRWYTLAKKRNVPVSAPMLQEEARIIATYISHHQFKTSNSWLESFKKRHNIRQFTIK